MDISVQQVVASALRLVGQMVAPGRNPSPEQLQEVIQFLNQRLSSWSIARNNIYTILENVYNLTPSVQFYSIGPTAIAGTFNGQPVQPLTAARPNSIQRANLIYQTAPQTLRLPMEIIDVDTWAAIQLEQIFALPLKLYYDRSYSQSTPTGNGLIYLWPGPQSAYQLDIFTTQSLAENLQSGDTIFCPDGVAEAITFDLALAIMPLYSNMCDEAREERIVRNATRSRRWMESYNAPWPIASMDPALVDNKSRDFNWLWSVN